ncbi:MAG: hypothetical protein GY829_05780 [Gammaproteobacteria bacterium]|nr:hypothetical protein [Gammaproteobacteria bacterium]
MEKIKFIVVHCSDTSPAMNVTTNDLRQWHVVERGWNDIGYHWFIKRDGTVYDCRPESVTGAHCPVINDCSIGICLEGGQFGSNDYTDVQLAGLSGLVYELKGRYNNAAVTGHNHFTSSKTCPNFNVVDWWEKVLTDNGGVM